jgi:GTP-binding protein HflX
MSRSPRATGRPRERALVVGVRLPAAMVGRSESLADLSEAHGLLEAAGAEVVGEGILQKSQRPTPATLFGKGKVQEIREEVERLHPDIVLVDNDLSPAQARNPRRRWACASSTAPS